jgi:hypothetical protein
MLPSQPSAILLASEEWWFVDRSCSLALLPPGTSGRNGTAGLYDDSAMVGELRLAINRLLTVSQPWSVYVKRKTFGFV